MASFSGVILHIAQIHSGYKKGQLRLVTSTRNGDSCRDLFKTLNILPLQPQYTFSLCFVVMNVDQYKVNSDTRHQTPPNLSLYPRGTYQMGIKISKSSFLHKRCVS